jgi:hypothetical protein
MRQNSDRGSRSHHHARRLPSSLCLYLAVAALCHHQNCRHPAASGQEAAVFPRFQPLGEKRTHPPTSEVSTLKMALLWDVAGKQDQDADWRMQGKASSAWGWFGVA